MEQQGRQKHRKCRLTEWVWAVRVRQLPQRAGVARRAHKCPSRRRPTTVNPATPNGRALPDLALFTLSHKRLRATHLATHCGPPRTTNKVGGHTQGYPRLLFLRARRGWGIFRSPRGAHSQATERSLLKRFITQPGSVLAQRMIPMAISCPAKSLSVKQLSTKCCSDIGG